jgi:hypothetical protein
MITIVKMIWIFWTVFIKVAAIGLSHHVVDKVFDILESMLDRYSGIVTVK